MASNLEKERMEKLLTSKFNSICSNIYGKKNFKLLLLEYGKICIRLGKESINE